MLPNSKWLPLKRHQLLYWIVFGQNTKFSSSFLRFTTKLYHYLNNNTASLGFIASPPHPPWNFRSPLDAKAPGPPLIYLVGPWVINQVITYSTPRTLEFKSCSVFPLWPESSIEVWLTDRQTGETGRPKDKHVGGSTTFETSYI